MCPLDLGSLAHLLDEVDLTACGCSGFVIQHSSIASTLFVAFIFVLSAAYSC
jgi:hypothetical protein